MPGSDAWLGQEAGEGTPPDPGRSDRDQAGAEMGPIVVCWPALSPAEAAAAMAELAEWVQWLANRYSIGALRIPDCWASHGDLVEELSALRTCWIVSFDPADAGRGPIGFQERLDAALRRRAFHDRCQAGHRPDPAPRNLAAGPPAAHTTGGQP